MYFTIESLLLQSQNRHIFGSQMGTFFERISQNWAVGLREEAMRRWVLMRYAGCITVGWGLISIDSRKAAVDLIFAFIPVVQFGKNFTGVLDHREQNQCECETYHFCGDQSEIRGTDQPRHLNAFVPNDLTASDSLNQETHIASNTVRQTAPCNAYLIFVVATAIRQIGNGPVFEFFSKSSIIADIEATATFKLKRKQSRYPMPICWSTALRAYLSLQLPQQFFSIPVHLAWHSEGTFDFVDNSELNGAFDLKSQKHFCKSPQHICRQTDKSYCTWFLEKCAAMAQAASATLMTPKTEAKMISPRTFSFAATTTPNVPTIVVKMPPATKAYTVMVI